MVTMKISPPKVVQFATNYVQHAARKPYQIVLLVQPLSSLKPLQINVKLAAKLDTMNLHLQFNNA